MNYKPACRILFAALCLGSLIHCSTNYYGYSETEWKRLSEEEKIKAKTEYEKIIRERTDQKHRDIIRDRDQQIIERGLEHY